MKTYLSVGDVRGECGHVHRTAVSAARCTLRDMRQCHRLGGGAYSDRTVKSVNGELTESEKQEVEEILNPA